MLAVAGIATSFSSRAFGGVGIPIQTPLLLMAVGLVSGINSAVVFKCSNKAETEPKQSGSPALRACNAYLKKGVA